MRPNPSAPSGLGRCAYYEIEKKIETTVMHTSQALIKFREKPSEAPVTLNTPRSPVASLMEFFNTTGLADDNTASQMNVDDEMTSFFKKRPREEDNNGGVPALPHSVSNDAEDDADDDFLTKILGGDETASAAQPSSFMSGVPPRFDSRMPSFDGP